MKYEKKNYEIIGEYFSEDTNEQKRKEISTYLQKRQSTASDLKAAQKIWNDSGLLFRVNHHDKKKHLAKINAAIFKDTSQKNIILRRFIKPYRYAAAVVLLVLSSIAAALYFNRANPARMAWVTKSTQANEKILVSLNDRTLIWLNHHSSISYPQNYGKENRSVKLKGEAFFDVAENKTQPFTIYTFGAHVSVLGTSFNLRDRDEEQKISLNVLSGKVSFADNENTKQVISANQKLLFDKNTKDLQLSIADRESNWRDIALTVVFEDTRLDLIVNTLSIQYGVPIVLKPGLDKQKLTAKYSTQRSLEDILTSISIALNLHYKFQEGQYIISQ